VLGEECVLRLTETHQTLLFYTHEKNEQTRSRMVLRAWSNVARSVSELGS